MYPLNFPVLYLSCKSTSIRATLPRLRYDQLVELCWLNLLPIAVAFIILVPSILIAFDISPY